VGTAFHGGTSQAAQCPSTVGSRTAVGGNSKRARGSPGSRRSHCQLGWPPLGRAPRRSLRGSSRGAGGNRATTGWFALATLPRPLSPPAPLPSTSATARKSFRPTACRTCGTKNKTKRQNQTQISCACPSPLEETMEPDISILRKTGHFYFALTVSIFCRFSQPSGALGPRYRLPAPFSLRRILCPTIRPGHGLRRAARLLAAAWPFAAPGGGQARQTGCGGS
jgi:hypothetical protein